MSQAQQGLQARTRAMSIDIDGVLHPVHVVDHLPTACSLLPFAQDLGLMRWAPVLATLLADHADVMLLVHSGWRQSVPLEEIRELLGPLRHWFLTTTPVELPRHDSIGEAVRRIGIDDLLVIDDDHRPFPPGWESLLLCVPDLGLSDVEVQARIQAWLEATRS